MSKITYKSGYKYQLVNDANFITGINFADYFANEYQGEVNIEVPFIRLSVGGAIMIGRGYAWDGVTAAPDFHRAQRAALLHDALYQLIRNGHLKPTARILADRAFRDMMRADGFKLRTLYFIAVRLFGKRAATPSAMRKPFTIE